MWARPLSDGTMADGLFNRAPVATAVRVPFAALGLSGPQPVRDLWTHTDLAPASATYEATVPRHGAMLVKVGRPQNRATPPK